ncbi:biopolymer transporter ExbD [Brachyspira hyodysenteriae]|uniref:Biopolymer transport protein ExbD/TolR n=2 Tax=Brachyspira hyodysenteriae TaxID=159 RepID=A0A3B6V817_BRAHW|nr:biopolymer transporter ExbD [Brachyspira hyodysenteriae]ACN82677.1 Biopolymer transport protein ExbD/TolR [Brachyspira hyodysenteriae WA1]ANN62693.1 biopolymer transporter ExbD [Brachyspira hyodysenteriae ATCC 27164]AUJ51001.1 biopolymer transporter ExbD [Brachyspira hyodysenteriae]KLI13274.1 biopolymer transporter ExbD [Brachyspira hyodysenteriae]KLI14099.1 biopolymer transporter ExbD [Brachyspira hyodysenteriae]
MKFRRRFNIKSGIDLTPMIDIVFNLLIFFMVGSTIIVTPQIEISLPKSTSAVGSDKNETVVISISKDGQKYINGYISEDIDADLKKLADTEGELEKPVEIRSDQDVKTQTLISVIDSVKNAGFTRLSIATETSNDN